MRVLVACEYSGRVRDAFTKRGHLALSCDLLPSEKPGRHYQGDVRRILGYKWDLMIAFPPCTYLSKAGAHLWPKRGADIERASDFFMELWSAPIPRICIENPPGWMNSHWQKPNQVIHPWWFGAPWSKQTCLWLRNLPDLFPSNPVPSGGAWVSSSSKRFGRNGQHRNPRTRGRTFRCVADAMAAQWGDLDIIPGTYGGY